MIRYLHKDVSSLETTCGFLTRFTLLLIGVLGSVAGHADSTVVLTAHLSDLAVVSADAPKQLPTIVSAESVPLSGQVVVAHEPAASQTSGPAGDESASESLPAADAAPKFSIVVTSMFDQKVIDRCELTPGHGESPTPLLEDPAAATKRWGFQLSQTLPSGVYELKLVPTLTVSSRFRELLPWERNGSKDCTGDMIQALSAQAWPLIVLPKVAAAEPNDDATTDTAAIEGEATPRQLLVHWSGFAEMVADAESLTSQSQSSSPLKWILNGYDHQRLTPAQRWAEIMHRIDERLDAIEATGATGIVVDAVSAEATADTRVPQMILLQCLHAKATQFDLAVWQHASAAESADSHHAHDGTSMTSLHRLATFSAPEASSQQRRVAAFRRPPPETIRGQFPAELDAAATADFLWFGCQRTPAVKLSQNPPASDQATVSAPDASLYPLAQQGETFQADAWLADWTSWCIRYSDKGLRQGLIVDEALLNSALLNRDMASGSSKVGDAVRVWETCWSDASRWLADSVPPQSGNSSGTSDRSLVQVRHANFGDGTVLVCLNQAPWPMRVRFPLANLVRWLDVAPAELGPLELTQPAVTELGSTIVIPASSMVVCCSEQRISSTMKYAAETEDARRRIAELTRQVTTIVENLGILGELAGMSTRTNSGGQRLAGNRRASAGNSIVRQASAIRPTAPPSSGVSRASGTPAATAGHSFWSSERWGLGRATTTSSDSTAQLVHAVSTTSPAQEGSADSGRHLAATSRRPNSGAEYRNLLGNGGFELPHEIGVPGWMHAHHPAGAVEIDTLVKSEGRQSIRLAGKTDAGASAWLISREIGRPIAGRLGISMSLRGQAPQLSMDTDGPVEPTPPMEIRVAIEGERHGQPIRHSQTVELPRNGKWHTGRFVLELLEVDSQQDRNLHITIDNLSTATVWIDDIVVTDYFASAAERSDLQSLAYLAVQGLQHSDLRPAAKLLNNFWARDLLRIASLHTISHEHDAGSIGVAREEPQPEKTYAERIGPRPMWGADAVSVDSSTRTGDTHESWRSTAHLPELPAATTASQESTKTVAVDPTDAESSASISGKIRRWLPAPLKF